MIPALSLVVAVYNNADNLRLILAALGRQSFSDFELLIADDGSGEDVRTLIASARQRYPFPIVHLWHEDRGWRKNVMLNRAIRAAQTGYLVFIDGDCLPSQHFLRDHWTEREPHRTLLGRRVEAGERWARSLTVERVERGEFERYGWAEWRDALTGKSLRVEDGIRIPSRLLRSLLLRDVHSMLGCNFSVWKEDLRAINGFDELYQGPGFGEDTDIEYRLSLIGVTGKSVRNLAILYHIFHPPTGYSEANRQRFELVKQSGEPRCVMGILKP